MRENALTAPDCRPAEDDPTQAAPQYFVQQEVIRDFNLGELDLDDLAAAIRQLLAPAPPLESGSPASRRPDLLLPRHGATHVVGGDAA